MPEPFKNLFSKKVVQHMGLHFTRVWAEFPSDEFVAVNCVKPEITRRGFSPHYWRVSGGGGKNLQQGK